MLLKSGSKNGGSCKHLNSQASQSRRRSKCWSFLKYCLLSNQTLLPRRVSTPSLGSWSGRSRAGAAGQCKEPLSWEPGRSGGDLSHPAQVLQVVLAQLSYDGSLNDSLFGRQVIF